MKHGPIALIDETVPVIVVAPSDDLFEKTASNLEEVWRAAARCSAPTPRASAAWRRGLASVELPKVDPFVAPILDAIPVQLLAYHAAVLRAPT